MSDEDIIMRGGTEDDIESYARNNGADGSYSDEEQLDKPNDVPDLSKTHSIVDIPKHGKVFVITDIYEYYKTIEAWHQQEIEKAKLEARIDELETIWKEHGREEGISGSDTPVLKYESIKVRIEELSKLQEKQDE